MLRTPGLPLRGILRRCPQDGSGVLSIEDHQRGGCMGRMAIGADGRCLETQFVLLSKQGCPPTGMGTCKK
jgi:hypothetical protein